MTKPNRFITPSTFTQTTMNNDIAKELLNRRTQALLDIERNSNTAIRTIEANKNGTLSDKETVAHLNECIERIRSHVFNATTTGFKINS